MKISVIIPTVNEATNIVRLIDRLQNNGQGAVSEILIVDAGSTDNTSALAKNAGATVFQSSKKGRAIQMNIGAANAKSELLYFVHADTLPPVDYIQHIQQALEEGYPIGCFQYRFDSNRWLLKINAWFTRLDRPWCRGGDQSLYISKTDFNDLGGFCEDYCIMEDFEFIERARQQFKFKIMPAKMVVSARKYETNSYLRVQIANLIVFNMYRFGASQERMAETYRRLLDYR